MNNEHSRRPIPTAGYRSLAEYRRAKKEERLRDVAERIAMIEQAALTQRARLDAEFLPWLEARCIENAMMESDIRELRASYVGWAEAHGKPVRPKQTWGRWMGARYRRVVRNSSGVGKVYLGVRVRPE